LNVHLKAAFTPSLTSLNSDNEALLSP
jgi:hypothetical protein